MTDVGDLVCGGEVDLDHIKAITLVFALVTLCKGGSGRDQMALLVGIHRGGRTSERGGVTEALYACLDLAKNVRVLLLRDNVDLVLAGNKVSYANGIAAKQKVTRGGIFPDPSLAQMLGKVAVLMRDQ